MANIKDSILNSIKHHRNINEIWKKNKINDMVNLGRCPFTARMWNTYIWLFVRKMKDCNLQKYSFGKRKDELFQILDSRTNSQFHNHCVKSVQVRKFFCSVFSRIRTRKNSVFGHFSHSEYDTKGWRSRHYKWLNK